MNIKGQAHNDTLQGHFITCPSESLPIFKKGQVNLVCVRLMGSAPWPGYPGTGVGPSSSKKTVGWNDKGHPIYDIIGYAATREEGLMILSEYNRDPWDVDRAKITLQQLFDLWKEKEGSEAGGFQQGFHDLCL